MTPNFSRFSRKNSSSLHSPTYWRNAELYFEQGKLFKEELYRRLEISQGSSTVDPLKQKVDWLNIVIFTRMSRACLLYTSPSPRDQRGSRMPSSA